MFDPGSKGGSDGSDGQGLSPAYDSSISVPGEWHCDRRTHMQVVDVRPVNPLDVVSPRTMAVIAALVFAQLAGIIALISEF